MAWRIIAVLIWVGVGAAIGLLTAALLVAAREDGDTEDGDE